MSESNSLDSMEGVNNETDNLDNLVEKLSELKSRFEGLLNIRFVSALREIGYQGTKYEEELRKIDQNLAKKFFLTVLLDSLIYISSSEDLEGVKDHISHYLCKVLGERNYIERNKDHMNSEELSFLIGVVMSVGDYYSSVPIAFHRKFAIGLYTKAMDLISLTTVNPEKQDLLDFLKNKVEKLKLDKIDSETDYFNTSQYLESIEKLGSEFRLIMLNNKSLILDFLS